MTRKVVAIAGIAALMAGLALARGKKGEAEPVVAPPPEVVTEAPPPPPPAPPLFPDGVPAHIDSLPTGLSSLSAQGCNACHYAAHETWSQSRHANAWSSPTFQTALHAAGDSTLCLGCHLPLASQHDQLAVSYVDGDSSRPVMQANSSFDLGLRGEGVTCAACHVRDGVVVGSREAPQAPHPVRVSTELRNPDFCATCHQLSWPGADKPYYDTWGEWKASRWAGAGVGCVDCHMAPVAGVLLPGSNGTLPSHGFKNSAARGISVLVRTSAAVAQRGQPLQVTITTQNTGAGHAFPTGNPNKAYTIEVQPLDSAGKALAPSFPIPFARTVESAAPYRTLSDTRLAPGAERVDSHSFSLSSKGAAGQGVLELRLLSSLGGEPTILQRIPIEFR
jgi:hypothetical protein